MGKKEKRSKLPGQRSRCPIAGTLDILGDRWTLLVVRDLLLGKKRFGEFRQSPEGIPSNILSDRIKRLEEAGLITSLLYSKHPPRSEYLLTPKGEELRPVMRAILEWAAKHLPGTAPMEPVGEPSLARTASPPPSRGSS